MRMRKKKHGAERIAKCADIIVNNSSDMPVKPYSLEIGCGKGGFITQAALREPDKFFLAMECQPNVLLLAAEKACALNIANIRFLIGNAMNLDELIGVGEVSELYLNFSDPWPKAKHYKRRLTYRDFLARYKRVLVPGGKIILKTDNANLFDFSLAEFTECGFELSGLTRDLHASEYNDGNIVTEYEENFSAKGFPIHRVIASLPIL